MTAKDIQTHLNKMPDLRETAAKKDKILSATEDYLRTRKVKTGLRTRLWKEVSVKDTTVLHLKMR